ncbi:MAG: DUF4864 domain-containing protein [Devosia sp.]
MVRIGGMGLMLAALLFVAPALAQSSSSSLPDPMASSSAPMAPTVSTASPASDATAGEWQAIIHNQVQAFREHNAATALSFAAQSFKDKYADPEAFYGFIMGSGYSAIAQSRSESFGPFDILQADEVLQDVKFIGADLSLYEAIYQLWREGEGWRVMGVQLVKTPGIGA